MTFEDREERHEMGGISLQDRISVGTGSGVSWHRTGRQLVQYKALVGTGLDVSWSMIRRQLAQDRATVGFGMLIPTLEATYAQIEDFFNQLPYKCHKNRVASVGD